MKKVITILLIALMLTGCGSSSMSGETGKANSARFVKVIDNVQFDIYVDTKTDVMYAVSCGAYNNGTVTLLVDREGKPLIWEGEQYETD